jgi:hypothetical protein
MTAAFVSGAITEPTSTSAGLTFTVASGNGYLVAFSWDAAINFTSVVSSLGNTLTIVGAEVSAFGQKTRVYRCVPTNFGSETVTVTIASSALIVMMRELVNGVASSAGGATPTTDASSPWTGNNATPSTADNIFVSVCFNNSTNASTTFTAGNGYTKDQEESDASTKWPLVTAYKVTASASAGGGSWTASQGSSGVVFDAVFSAASSSPATLSSATPSGTLVSTTSATLGATTDQASGNFYGVVDSAGNISGITATQVKAGQNNAGGAPVASGNSVASTTTPSISVSGLTANTLYSYAVAQNNSNGDSNVLTGTFTTAANVSADARKFGPQGFLTTLLGM